MDLIKILNWIYSYSSSLSLFGIKDERLAASSKTLSTILTKKMLKTGVTMIFNILLEVNLQDCMKINGIDKRFTS